MGSKVFLTGATGFIGSQVARRLAADGHEVHALIRPGADTRRLEGVRDRLAVVEGHLSEPEALQGPLERVRPEVCIHLAWYAEPGQYLVSRENLRCLASSLELARRLADLGCRKFVGAGTCIEYDTDFGYLSETTPTAPRTLYAASKLGLFLVLEQLSRLTGMTVAWARFFYLYGPHEDPRRLVPSVIRALLRGEVAPTTGGAQVRDWLHVEDAAAAVCAVALCEAAGPFNIGSGEPVTVRRVVEAIGALVGRPDLLEPGRIPYSKGDPMFICSNNSRLKATGWVPRFDLERGLRGAIDWWAGR
jgi:nucleoside-diphosphate-sugar epimerase